MTRKKSRRPRIDEDLFEILDDKKSNPNQGIDEVLMDEFPKLREMVESQKNKEKNKNSLF